MLFNKNGTGITEMRNHAGFLDGNIPYENIKSDLLIATEEIHKIVGTDIMDAADAHYNSDDFQKPNATDSQKLLDKLCEHLQLPITLLSVIDYMDSNDVSHEDSGRKMKLADGEKQAFQWMLDRDNAIMLKKANKAIDRLIAFLDSNLETEPIATAWGGSEEYGVSKDRFVASAKEFDAIFPIEESRQFYLRICPFMKQNEAKTIIPIITKERFDLLKEQLKDKEPDIDQVLLLHVQNSVVYLSLKDAVERLSMKYLPETIIDDSFIPQGASKLNRRAELTARFKELAASELSDLQKYITSLLPTTPDEYVKDLSNEKFYRA